MLLSLDRYFDTSPGMSFNLSTVGKNYLFVKNGYSLLFYFKLFYFFISFQCVF